MTAVLARPASAIDRADPFVLVARLSLVVLLVNTHSEPWQLVAAAAACAVMFLNEGLLRSPWPWLAIAAVLGWAQFSEWWQLDDHLVATTYLLAAIGLSRMADDPQGTLRLAARLIVGGIFAFAFFWKLLSSQYTEVDFFRYTLLRDDRFEPVVLTVGGADDQTLERQRVEITEFINSGQAGDTLVVEQAPRTEWVAHLFTWWGLAIEGAIALAFLWPLRGRATVARPASLVVFCATTYAVVPVLGFGLLLTTLGLTQVDGLRWRRVFVIGSAAMFVWSGIMTGLVL